MFEDVQKVHDFKTQSSDGACKPQPEAGQPRGFQGPLTSCAIKQDGCTYQVVFIR